ncbi:MAG TPA: NUDIX hydrolase [Stellaceae bacterium]|nr:NUDIX hydrolase [Stellaceae bacterium]
MTGAILHQAGAIAYRIVAGEVRVLLMTSRETGRWIIPKGNIDSGSAPCAAAEQEAYEEAGVRGVVRSTPLGFYTYFKRLRSGAVRAATVEVYLLRVTERLKKWPEKGERRLSWVSIDAAIGLVEEPGIAPLLQRLAEFEENLRPEQARPARRCSAAPGG